MNFNINRSTWKHDKHTTDHVSTKNECCDHVLINQHKNKLGGSFDKYPDIKTGYESLAKLCDVDSNRIYVSFGSSHVLKDLITVLDFQTIQLFEPGFELMNVYCELMNKTILLNRFTYTHDQFTHEDIIQTGGDVLYLTNPHCPTCVTYSSEYIAQLSKRFKYIIIDEAYTNPLTISRSLQHIHNVIIVKTFSKIGGVPGLRFGFCHASVAIIDKLMCVKPMYEMSSDVVDYIQICDMDRFNSSIQRMTDTANLLREQYPSRFVNYDGNFCLMKGHDQFKGKKYTINNHQFTRVTLTDPAGVDQLSI